MSLGRTLLLAAADNRWLAERATKAPFVRRSVSRFMPGERLEDAMDASAAQQALGIGSILTRLGENLKRVEEAEAVTRHYLDVLDHLQQKALPAHISVKLTQLGLDLDRELCYRNLQALLDRAVERDNFVWIDMESSPYVEPTLDLFRRTRARTSRVGIALQAYLYRTERDLESLLPLGAAIRIVKGAYLESPDIAFPKKADVDANFYKLACRALADDAQRAGGLLHIATHDPQLIERMNSFMAERRVPASAYEYAMLYGIQRPLQLRLAEQGRRVRVLISYGEHWFQWYMRRLAERPANVWFVVKNLAGS